MEIACNEWYSKSLLSCFPLLIILKCQFAGRLEALKESNIRGVGISWGDKNALKSKIMLIYSSLCS